MKADFQIGECIVRPQRDCIRRGGKVTHVAPKSMAVLLCLAQTPGQVVSRQKLFDVVWPGAVVSDDALTQRISELRKALGDSAYNPRFIETVPKVGFRLIPPVEKLPAGQPAGTATDRLSPAPRRRAVFTASALLLLIVLAFMFRAGVRDTPEPAGQAQLPSIAVLPFTNLSADEDSEYFCTGVAEAILNMLAQSPDLLVASGTSSFQPRLKGLSVPEIAGLLGVDTILEGSVQRQGDKLRVTAQLIDAENDVHLWSRNFDRDNSDIFAIQDEISEAVVAAFMIAMRDDVKQRIDLEGTANADAYDAYMKARSLVYAGKYQGAVMHVEKAIELDPEYARAYVLKGHLYGAFDTWPELHTQEKTRRGREVARQAVRLAPDMSAALVLLAAYTEDQELKGQLLRRAYEKGPNDVQAILAYAQYLVWEPNPALSEELARKALALDPLAEGTYWNLAILRMGERRIDQALEIIALWKERIPESTQARWMEGLSYFLLGEYRSSVAAHIESVELEPDNFGLRLYVASSYLLAGMPEHARRWGESMTGPGQVSQRFTRISRTLLDIYFQRNDEQVFTESKQLLLDGVIADDRRSRILTWLVEYGTRLGRLDEVLETLGELYPHLFAEPPHSLENDKFALYASGLALLEHGDTAKGEPLMRAFLDIQDKEDMTYNVRPGSISGRLALGEREAALQKFREFAEARWYWAGNTPQLMFRYSRLYDPIRNEPEFIALLELYDRNAAEQRRLLEEADFPLPSE